MGAAAQLIAHLHGRHLTGRKFFNEFSKYQHDDPVLDNRMPPWLATQFFEACRPHDMLSQWIHTDKQHLTSWLHTLRQGEALRDPEALRTTYAAVLRFWEPFDADDDVERRGWHRYCREQLQLPKLNEGLALASWGLLNYMMDVVPGPLRAAVDGYRTRAVKAAIVQSHAADNCQALGYAMYRRTLSPSADRHRQLKVVRLLTSACMRSSQGARALSLLLLLAWRDWPVVRMALGTLVRHPGEGAPIATVLAALVHPEPLAGHLHALDVPDDIAVSLGVETRITEGTPQHAAAGRP